MDELKERLTNEEIKKRAGLDSFNLVNYAIGLGKENILRGRDFHTHTTIRNQAYVILKEIYEGADKLPVIEREVEEVE